MVDENRVEKAHLTVFQIWFKISAMGNNDKCTKILIRLVSRI